MTTRWHIGAKDLRGAVSAYAKRFDLLEVRVGLESAEGGPREAPGAKDGQTAPTLSTLKRWRKSVPPHFDFAVVAGRHLSKVKASAAADRELDAARAAIDVLQARCFVLRTPPDVTPTSLWRDRIGKLVAKFPNDVTRFVWEPSGVWENDAAAAQAHAWDALLAVDPVKEAVPAGPVAYVRLRAFGGTRAFGSTVLERVVTAVGERREVFAIIETDTALVEAKRLRSLVQASRSGPRPQGRLVRPRGGIVVRDDEQE
jgi:uncharacterized protein YecE (DUF72 family)